MLGTRLRTGWCVLLAAVLLAGCAARFHGWFRSTITRTAVQHLDCPASDVVIEGFEGWAFRATGCGRTGWYRCTMIRNGSCCHPTSETEARATFAPQRFPGDFTGNGQVCN
jgi:hypothetical protein